jgi:hypothetical protein
MMEHPKKLPDAYDFEIVVQQYGLRTADFLDAFMRIRPAANQEDRGAR